MLLRAPIAHHCRAQPMHLHRGHEIVCADLCDLPGLNHSTLPMQFPTDSQLDDVVVCCGQIPKSDMHEAAAIWRALYGNHAGHSVQHYVLDVTAPAHQSGEPASAPHQSREQAWRTCAVRLMARGIAGIDAAAVIRCWRNSHA